MSHNAPTTLKSQIESRWAAGQSAMTIAAEMNANLDYVQRTIYFANRRPAPVDSFKGNDDLHLALISKAHGRGFPVLRIGYRRAA